MALQEIVKTRVDKELKDEAATIFKSMGLNVSEAIRLFFQQTILMQQIPFSIYSPNSETIAAIEKAKKGSDGRTVSLDEAFKIIDE